MAINRQQVRTALAHVMHPEMDKDLITLDMIEDLIVQDSFITFTIDLPEKNAKLEKRLREMSEEAIRKFVAKDAVLDINTAVNISKFRNKNGDKKSFPGQGHREKG